MGVWRGLSARFGGRTVTVLRGAVHFERFHAAPEETCRALRTLLVREMPAGVAPLRYFYSLFKLALRGEALCDRAAWREADREAVLDEMMRGAPDPDDPARAWQGFVDSLEGRLTAVRLADAGSEHAQILEAAVLRAREGLAHARALAMRDAAFEDDARIARDFGARPFTTPEARYAALDARLDVEDHERERAEREAQQLAALPDDALTAHIRAAAEAVLRAQNAQRWHAEEHAQALLRKYAAEQVRRRDRAAGPDPERARVTPAADPEHDA